MISNISITPIKTMFKNALNIHNFSFKSHTSTAINGQKQRLKIDLALSHHPQLVIMDEPETSLEQNALIRLSNLISLRNTQQLTSIIATHDPIVLDSCEWVLLLKNGNIAQYKPLNSILKSVAKTFNFKEKPTTKDLLALLKDI
ncbi:hypothetical protein HpEKB48_13640 [Helicobacter pylori]